MGELQHILARQTGAEHDRKQFCIGQRLAAHGEQFFAGAGVFGQVFEQHGQRTIKACGHGVSVNLRCLACQKAWSVSLDFCDPWPFYNSDCLQRRP
jgi:hypothetical protein